MNFTRDFLYQHKTPFAFIIIPSKTMVSSKSPHAKGLVQVWESHRSPNKVSDNFFTEQHTKRLKKRINGHKRQSVSVQWETRIDQIDKEFTWCRNWLYIFVRQVFSFNQWQCYMKFNGSLQKFLPLLSSPII